MNKTAVPFFDMHNHNNDPRKLNVVTEKPEEKGQSFFMRTMKDVKPGEQLFISYNRCNRCWYDESYKGCPSWSHYGTSELFDIFGFVEGFPQTWKFRMNIGTEENPEWDDLSFCLERYVDDGPLVVTFGDNYTPNPQEEMPVEANVRLLGEHLMRLKELETTMKSDTKLMETIPKHEWDMAWNYQKALMTSISAALLASDLIHIESSDDSGDSSDDASGDEGGKDEL